MKHVWLGIVTITMIFLLMGALGIQLWLGDYRITTLLLWFYVTLNGIKMWIERSIAKDENRI